MDKERTVNREETIVAYFEMLYIKRDARLTTLLCKKLSTNPKK
jgi:hypothetical protein